MTLFRRRLGRLGFVGVLSFPVCAALAVATAFAQAPKPLAPTHPVVPVAPAARPTAPPGAPTVAAPAAPAAPAAVAAPAAPAPPPAPVAPPKPAAELDQLKFLLGKWRCDGRQFAGPINGPEHTFKATAETKPVVDGFWHQFNYEEKTSKEHRGFKVSGLWGWDAGNKRFVRAGGSTNGTWDTGTSPGMEADKLVWTGELSNARVRVAFRHTFAKKSDKEWSHMIELKDPAGKWVPNSECTCKH